MSDSTDPIDSSEGRVSLKEVLRVAELAQLELTAAEQTEMLRDLNSILGHVGELNQLDTADVEPMTQMNAVVAEGAALESGLRADAPRTSLDRKTVMAEAPETDGTYFKVPKVIER